MKLQTELRTVSRNGQVALPKRFLEALGVSPLAKVRVIKEKDSIVIRKSTMTKMSDEDFERMLNEIRRRNKGVTARQVAESIRQVRQSA